VTQQQIYEDQGVIRFEIIGGKRFNDMLDGPRLKSLHFAIGVLRNEILWQLQIVDEDEAAPPGALRSRACS
jgi:hypothetical protein